MTPVSTHLWRLTWLWSAAVVAALGCPAHSSAAVAIAGDGKTGHFTGTLEYDPATAQLTVQLTNATPASQRSYITGFVLPNPANELKNVAFRSSPYRLSLLGGPGFRAGIQASPFGDFDLGAAIDGNWQETNNPAAGIGSGSTGTFVFTLEGENLDQLTTEDFLKETNPAGHFLVVRFQGDEADADDAVAAIENPVPEPASIVLFGIGLGTLAIFGWQLRLRLFHRVHAQPG